jgi:hypothetical protein
MSRLLPLLLFLLISFGAFSQDSNPRKAHPFGISAVALGPSGALSLSLDWFVVPTINVEAGAGLFGYYGGAQYHFQGNENKNWTPYAGGYLIEYMEILGSDYSGAYVPVGMQYLGNKGFRFAIEVAYVNIPNNDHATNVWGALKLGFHF